MVGSVCGEGLVGWNVCGVQEQDCVLPGGKSGVTSVGAMGRLLKRFSLWQRFILLQPGVVHFRSV